MPATEAQIQPHASGNGAEACAREVWRVPPVAFLAAGALGLLGWLVLRNPEWRAALVGLVPHRYPIAFAQMRQMLAPRSLALAGAVFLSLGAWFAFPRRAIVGTAAVRMLPWPAALFVCVQGMLALSVVLNLQFYFWRTFHRPPCRITEEEIFQHWAPQAYPHALQLKQQLPQGAHVITQAHGGTFNLYLLSAMAYPLRCYYAETSSTLRTSSLNAHRDQAPSSWWFLDYDPFDATSPLRLREIPEP